MYIYNMYIYANINSYRGFFSSFAFIFGLENVLQHRVYVENQTRRVPETLHRNGQKRGRHADGASAPRADTRTC